MKQFLPKEGMVAEWEKIVFEMERNSENGYGLIQVF